MNDYSKTFIYSRMNNWFVIRSLNTQLRQIREAVLLVVGSYAMIHFHVCLRSCVSDFFLAVLTDLHHFQWLVLCSRCIELRQVAARDEMHHDRIRVPMTDADVAMMISAVSLFQREEELDFFFSQSNPIRVEFLFKLAGRIHNICLWN